MSDVYKLLLTRRHWHVLEALRDGKPRGITRLPNGNGHCIACCFVSDTTITELMADHLIERSMGANYRITPDGLQALTERQKERGR